MNESINDELTNEEIRMLIEIINSVSIPGKVLEKVYQLKKKLEISLIPVEVKSDAKPA